MLAQMGRTGGDFPGMKGGGMDMVSRAFVVLGESRNGMGVYYLDSRMVQVECLLSPMNRLYIGFSGLVGIHYASFGT